jgi:hypothetical protein
MLPAQAQPLVPQIYGEEKGIEELNRLLTTPGAFESMMRDGKAPSPQQAAPDGNERNPLEQQLASLRTMAASRAYSDVRQVLTSQGFSPVRRIKSAADVIKSCPVGYEGPCRQMPEVDTCFLTLTLVCDLAWASPAAANGDADVVVTVAYGRYAIPTVSNIQTMEARRQQREASVKEDAAARERQKIETESLYVNARKYLLEEGFTPAHDNGGRNGVECNANPNPWVCHAYRENSACVSGEYCTFEWQHPEKGHVRVFTDEGGNPNAISFTRLEQEP